VPKKINLVIALAVVGFVAYVVLSSFSLRKVSCEVCVDFQGRNACRTANGPTREEAINTAQDNACATIAQGRTQSILCGGAQPASVTCSE
jgi:hypothetical protein